MNDLAKKVQVLLESSQNISFLHEFCHKQKLSLPEWKPISRPAIGQHPYLHGMQLSIIGQKFEVHGVPNKSDAKKACAAAAMVLGRII